MKAELAADPDAAAGEAGQAPFAGIRVLDFSQVIAGPYCTMLLADMGADVVKVERPGVGDDMRLIGRYAGRAAHDEDYFYSVNRRKRSITLDLKTDGDREIARDLAAGADVVVQNFAPGTAERLGVGPDELLARNPRLVYCAISGFGQTGPLRSAPALDPIIQAMSGIMCATGEPGGPPVAVGAPIADVVSGMFAAYAIAAGLRTAERTGEGSFLDVSMLESMISVLSPRLGEPLQANRQPARVGNENPMRVPGGMFQAGDGNYVDFIVMNQSHWPPFCRALEFPEWVEDPRFVDPPSRVTHRAELNALVSAVIAQRSAAEWLARFEVEHVPSSPVLDYVAATQHPHILERGTIVSVEHPKSGQIKLVAPPWRSTLPEPKLTPPPLLGEHTDAVLGDWLGWSADAIEGRLRAAADVR